ncbi:MAG: integral rane protein, partial [Anaerosporomusa subterranea]|nr:integral rane protein [Anaerosporomusa subterranea]
MIAAGKILLTLSIIVFLLRLKTPIAKAMLGGSLVLFFLSEPTLPKLTTAAWATVSSHSAWEIILALYFVMCLEYQLRTHGIIDGLMAAARRLLQSDRVLLAAMPAFLGFLPSLGGAIFSAPLVENASRSYQISAEVKSAVNYWFRHVWEFTNPIMTGMLLASQISNIPLADLIVKMAWITVFTILIGWLFLVVPLKPTTAPASVLESGTDLTSTTTHKRYVALAVSPILANLALVVLFKLNASLSMALIVLCVTGILRQNAADIRAMLIHAFDRKLLWGIIGIIFFQNILRQSGAVGDIGIILNDLAVPSVVAIGIIAFISGLLTGTSQGFVAITFPFIAELSPGDLNLAMICFVMGTAGQMLSPAHLCLLVTLDYFKADLLKTLRPIFVMQAIV